VERSGIPASHSEMCKFESASATGYRLVAAAILRYIKQAPQTIETRWVNAKEFLAMQRSIEASELLRE
jgi:hypothetical protein